MGYLISKIKGSKIYEREKKSVLRQVGTTFDLFFNRIFFCKNLQKKYFQSVRNKKEKHTYTQLHQYSRFSLSKKGVWPVFVATSLLKKFLFKNKTCRKHYRTQPAKFSFFSNGRSQAGKIFFFSLNSRISLAQNLAFRLPAMTNGLLL